MNPPRVQSNIPSLMAEEEEEDSAEDLAEEEEEEMGQPKYF